MPTLYTVSSVSAQLADQSLQSLTMMLTIIACASLIAAFLVVGLLIQREHDTQENIARHVRRNHIAQALRSPATTSAIPATPATPVAVPVPLAGALDGGAPLPTVALIGNSPAPEITSEIPDEVPARQIGQIGRIGDIAEQPTWIIPAAEMAAMVSAIAAREQVPPQILEALGARWILAMPCMLLDDARS